MSHTSSMRHVASTPHWVACASQRTIDITQTDWVLSVSWVDHHVDTRLCSCTCRSPCPQQCCLRRLALFVSQIECSSDQSVVYWPVYIVPTYLRLTGTAEVTDYTHSIHSPSQSSESPVTTWWRKVGICFIPSGSHNYLSVRNAAAAVSHSAHSLVLRAPHRQHAWSDRYIGHRP